MLSILSMSFGFIAPKKLEIIWLSNLSIVIVPVEVYPRNASCALYVIPAFLLVQYELVRITDI
jgi:hypothetical protein